MSYTDPEFAALRALMPARILAAFGIDARDLLNEHQRVDRKA